MEGLECDLVIAGAGPGGLGAANEGARLGLDTVLLERQYEIGYPIRTTGGSFIDEVEKLGIPKKYYNKIRRVVFATRNKKAVFEYERYPMCVMDVRAVYQHFAKEAMRKGVRLMLGTEAKSLIVENRHAKGVVAKKAEKEIRIGAKVTIDATGFPAVLARQMGTYPKGDTRFAAGAEYEAYVENLEADTVIITYDKASVPSGYGWVFPLSKERARIGLGLIRPDSNLQTFKLLDDYVFNKRNNALKELGKIDPVEMHAGNIPIEPVSITNSANGFMAIGDAAVQATPVAGEGIRIAMNGGITAARVAADAIAKGDTTKRAFAAYEREVAKLNVYNKIGLRIQKRLVALTEDERDMCVETLVSKLTKLPVEDFMKLMKGELSKAFLLKIAAKNPGALAATVRKYISRK